MIARIGLRLALAGGRQALLRLAFVVIGVWVALTLLLLALMAAAAAHGRDDRANWLNAAYAFTPDGASVAPLPVESADGALFLAVTDYHDGTRFTRAYVAALGADPPVPPGLDRLPGPGEVAVSPAMARLLESTPDDRLAGRLPGAVTMTIGPAGLAHEHSLVALIGRTPDQLDGVRSVREVTGFDIAPNGPFGLGPAGIVEVFVVFGLVLLLGPVVIVIFMVTRVGWAQREQRIASIRLAGASRLQTVVIAGIETGLAAVAGTVLAWASYEVIRRIVARTLVFQGGHFWQDDVAVPLWFLVLILAGTPVLVMLAPIGSLYWAAGNPLAVSRLGRRPAPRAWMAVPLAAAVTATLIADPAHELLGPDLSSLFTMATVASYLLGLVLIGPWLCMVVSAAVARFSRGVPGLIAARRIGADPYAAFRTVSIVVLAVATFTFIGSTAAALEVPDEPGDQWVAKPGVIVVTTGGVPAEQVAPLLSGQVVAVRAEIGGEGFLTNEQVPCAELSRVRHVSCPYAADGNFHEPGSDAGSLVVSDLYVITDGSLAADSRVRNQVAGLVPNAIINSVRDPVDYDGGTYFADFGVLVNTASVFVLLLAVIGLTAGMLGGLIERRRPFALLRASGVRLGELRRALFLETAATMVFTSAVGVVLGMLLAYAATRQAELRWTWPALEVYGYAGAGVLAALALSTLALPLLNAATRHHNIRYE